MITGTGTNKDGKKLLLLGLSQGTIDKLKEGKPLSMTRASHGEAIPEGLEICIMFGKTEQDIVEELRGFRIRR